jgi:hypothetical protein
MATIITSHRTTVTMMNSIHALLSENHPCTLFMVSLPSGYHAPPNPIHYHILRLMTNPPVVACYASVSGQSPSHRLGAFLVGSFNRVLGYAQH